MPFVFTAPKPPARSLRFAAPSDTDYRAIHATADAQVSGMTDELLDAFDELESAAELSQLETAITAGDTNAGLDAATWTSFEQALDALSKETFDAVVATAGAATARQLARQIGMAGGRGQPPTGLLSLVPSPEPDGTFVARFDLRNPEALRWIDEHAAELVRQVTDETRLAIRSLVKRSFVDGIPPRDAARMLRSVIGLTARQANAVYNYEKFLRGFGPEPIEMLSQRDIERLLRGGLRQNQVAKLQREGMSEARIAKLVDGYRQRLLHERAETIARTETLRASNAGQLNLWRQAVDKGLLSDDVRKKWLDTGDGRTCLLCRKAAGQTVPLDEPFQTMNGPSMVPQDSHPRCRCAMRLVQGGNR